METILQYLYRIPDNMSSVNIDKAQKKLDRKGSKGEILNKLDKEDFQEKIKSQYDVIARLGDKNETLNDEIQKLRKEKAILEKEKDEALSRLSQLAGQKLTQGNPAITDLGNPNRPAKVGERWSSLYTDEWTDAYEDINSKSISTDGEHPCPEKQLIKIVDWCYGRCKLLIQNQDTKIRELLWHVVRQIHFLGDGPTNLANNDRMKEKRDPDIQITLAGMDPLVENALNQRVNSTTLVDAATKICLNDYKTGHSDATQNEIKFVQKCSELCWYICSSDPPMIIEYEDFAKNTMDANKFNKYNRTGTIVEYVVWPALLLHKDGPVLAKGTVQTNPGPAKTKKNLKQMNPNKENGERSLQLPEKDKNLEKDGDQKTKEETVIEQKEIETFEKKSEPNAEKQPTETTHRIELERENEKTEITENDTAKLQSMSSKTFKNEGGNIPQNIEQRISQNEMEPPTECRRDGNDIFFKVSDTKSEESNGKEIIESNNSETNEESVVNSYVVVSHQDVPVTKGVETENVVNKADKKSSNLYSNHDHRYTDTNPENEENCPSKKNWKEENPQTFMMHKNQETQPTAASDQDNKPNVPQNSKGNTDERKQTRVGRFKASVEDIFKSPKFSRSLSANVKEDRPALYRRASYDVLSTKEERRPFCRQKSEDVLDSQRKNETNPDGNDKYEGTFKDESLQEVDKTDKKVNIAKDTEKSQLKNTKYYVKSDKERTKHTDTIKRNFEKVVNETSIPTNLKQLSKDKESVA